MADSAEPVRSGLDSLIGDLCDSARVDSSGKFTLDPAKALEKMRRFASFEPHHYLLWLAAAAVVGRASYFNVLVGVERITVEFDGEPLGDEELDEVFGEGGPHRKGRVGHLATALCSALALKPKELVMEAGTTRISVTASDSRLQKIKEPNPGKALVFYLNSGVREKFLGIVMTMRDPAPEQDLLKTRIVSAQMKISVNGKDWRAGWTPYSACAYRRLQGAPLLQLPSQGKDAVWDEHPSPGPFSAVIGLSKDRMQGDSTLVFVVDGVTFPVVRKSDLAYEALVFCPDLQLDVTRTRPVEDRFSIWCWRSSMLRSLRCLSSFLTDSNSSRPGGSIT